MPRFAVPTQSTSSRSNKSAVTCQLLVSTSPLITGLHASFVKCCNPSPGPPLITPLHIEPSGATTTDVNPCNPALRLSPKGANTCEWPPCHRASLSDVAIQIAPDFSTARETAFLNGTPCAGP